MGISRGNKITGVLFAMLLSAILPCTVSADFLSGNMDAGKTVMVFTGTWTGGSTAGTTEMKVFTKRATSYVLGDLSGTWHINTLASGPGAPWWLRGTLAFSLNGSYTMTYDDSDGWHDTENGAFSISPDGIITGIVLPTAVFRMDADKTVMAGTSTWPDGTADFPILVKQAASYSISDLTGIWYAHDLASGPGAPNWSRSIHTIGANGASTSTRVESNGDTHTSTETMLLTPDGIMTIAGFTEPVQCAMDSGKTVLACTDTWLNAGPDTGTTSNSVVVKKAASYSLADLVGTWDGNSLASGPGAPWWERAAITISADGSFAGTATYIDDATPEPIGGTMAISSGGVVTPLWPGQYLLASSAGGYGAGSITSGTGGINYTYPPFDYGAAAIDAGTSSITLTAGAGNDSTVSWSGDCSSTGGSSASATCTINTMNSAKSITAAFAKKPVRISESATYYMAIQPAYDAAGANQTVQIQATSLTENVLLASLNAVQLKGGYSADFSSNTGWTTIIGTLTFGGGIVTIENIAVM